jgi:hypothetical protein
VACVKCRTSQITETFQPCDLRVSGVISYATRYVVDQSGFDPAACSLRTTSNGVPRKSCCNDFSWRLYSDHRMEQKAGHAYYLPRRRLQKDSLERSSMLDSLQVIAELLRVFAFSLLGITLGVVVYALLQVFLQGVTRQKEPRNGSGHGNTRCDNQEREAPINWHDFQTTPHISAGFTRDVK